MAFGKKKDDAAAEAETGPVDDLTPEEDTAATDESPDASVDSAPEDAAEEPPAEPAAAAPAGADALLSMFQESKVAAEDLSILTDLAGDADIDDILEELRTLRAALGITDAFEEDEDFAAAA